MKNEDVSWITDEVLYVEFGEHTRWAEHPEIRKHNNALSEKISQGEDVMPKEWKVFPPRSLFVAMIVEALKWGISEVKRETFVEYLKAHPKEIIKSLDEEPSHMSEEANQRLRSWVRETYGI